MRPARLQEANVTKPTSDALLMPSNSVIAGDNIAKLTEELWTWQFQSQYLTNPLLDTSGAYADVNNNGPVFFFAGTLDQTGTVTRTFDVPHDTPILVPILEYAGIQYTGTGPDPKNTATGTPASANDQLHTWQKNVDSLFLTIDGVAVNNLFGDLVKTGFFDMGPVAPGSLADALGLTGELSHTKSEGYYALLNGFSLGSGDHTIEFGGTVGAYTLNGENVAGYTNHVVDHIHIV
jgi:hypothetical protein